jgi:NAD(P)-dependent dehydrogenase (short-subunit alcohol dehydrogenase family)
MTENELEIMFQVNYLSQFYLARLLMKTLLLDGDGSESISRIVVISCESHSGSNLERYTINKDQLNVKKDDFDFCQVFCNTKFCNILFASELNRRLNKMKITNLICKSCHPGNMLQTNLFTKYSSFRLLNTFTKYFVKSIEQAAATPVYLATVDSSKLKAECFYYINFTECLGSRNSYDHVLAYRLWETSESMLIENTKSFDNYLAIGDEFSSFTIVEPEINH